MADSGQETLFLEAYEAHADSIFRYCFFKLSDREAALDAVQEIFTKVWNYLERGNSITDFQGFIWTTAANHVKDQWKRKKAVPMSIMTDAEDAEPFDAADEGADFLQGIEYQLALETFKKLPDADRELLTLRFVEDKTVKEIAQLFGERENTVAVRISRAIVRLRELLS